MGNGILKISNLKKTYYYLKKNGLRPAYFAVLERMNQRKNADYDYTPPSEETLDRQRALAKRYPYHFSILVPAYETDSVYFDEMLKSVQNQTYENWELIIADASSSHRVESICQKQEDKRIRYIRLGENKGISGNTNAALEAAVGDYIGLLDHDDVLTSDALYEMAAAIEQKEQNNIPAWMLYSDEDKGNESCRVFYEPHRKLGFNKDLLLSNNYICHFLVMKKELMKDLKFRTEYDGAQDYDLILRAAAILMKEKSGEHSIIHVPKVLYHWRCHSASTADNPESKRYAYEAGKRALEYFIKSMGWNAAVENTKHLGFYRIKYYPDIFACRPEVGVIGGKIIDRKNRISGGIYLKEGTALYIGLHREFSGYMHRASLIQETDAVDVRCMKVRKELWGMFEEVFGVPYEENKLFDYYKLEKYTTEDEIKEASIQFCQKARGAGYCIIWMPEYAVKVKKEQ